MSTEKWDTSTLGKYYDPDDINRCACGYTAALLQQEIYFWIQCTRQDCWHGPVLKRRDKAIKAWNSIMKRGEK